MTILCDLMVPACTFLWSYILCQGLLLLLPFWLSLLHDILFTFLSEGHFCSVVRLKNGLCEHFYNVIPHSDFCNYIGKLPINLFLLLTC